MAELKLGNIKPVGADNVVVEAKYVKGSYVTVANITERDALKGANGENIVKGSLCYCQADNNYYKYNGTSWEPDFVVDSTLSDISTNAIQNKVVKAALDGKANSSHGNHVPTTEAADNKKFLRNDNTWADVTPANIGAVPSAEKGVANGVATLDQNGLVLSSQLPSFVDDVIEGYYQESSDKFYEFYNEENGSYDKELSSEGGKIYVDLNNKKTYRWSGSGFVVISETIAIGTTIGTALDGKVGNDHITNDSNPHGVTKDQVGLGNVDNTADADKRVAYAEEAGHADSATKATKDANDNVITEIYATKSELQTNTDDHTTIRGEISELSGQIEELLKVDGDTLEQLEEVLKDLENSGALLEKKLEIIDVDALPTNNIDTNVLYRLFTATLIHNRHVVDNSTCYIVDTLPEVGEVATDDQQSFIKAYYSLDNNTLYGYLDETLAYGFSQLAGATLAAGWYPASNLLPMAGWPYDGVITGIVDDPKDSKIRLLLETKIYCYQNDWVELTNSIVDEKLPTPERDGHFAYTVQRRDGKDAYELHLISHSINEAYKDGELMYPYQIPLRDHGVIKTAEPIEDLDAANKKYVDSTTAPCMTKFDESWGHNRVYYIKNAQLTEDGEIPTTTELSIEVPAGKSIMVCALQDDNNESDYSYIDANGLPIEPPIKYGREGALATPTVTINGSVASWAAVDGATHYSYLIGTPTAYNSTSNTFANTYNRVYVERTKNRGVYSRYALSSVNAPVDPDPADFARDIRLDSVPMRMSNGYIMSPMIDASNQSALDEIAKRGYNLGYYLMPKSYTDSYTAKYVDENVPIILGAGEYSIVLKTGTNPNKVTGKFATALGENNEISGLRGFSAGYNNKVSASCGSAFGQDVDNSAWLGFGAGQGLQIKYNKQSVFGEYNKPIEKDGMGYRLLHSIGNGTSSNRSNAFEVYSDGRAVIGRAPVYQMDVANRGYVDNQVSQINAKITTLETKISGSQIDDSIFDLVLNLQTGVN